MMRSVRRVVLETGIAGGLLFTAHASIPNCYSWPMIWPALAGATAVWLVTREPDAHRWRTGFLAALATGVMTGLIAFIALSIVVYVVVHSGITPALRQGGVSSSGVTASLTAAGILAIAASLAAIDVIVAFIGGVLVLPARYFQARHAHA